MINVYFGGYPSLFTLGCPKSKKSETEKINDEFSRKLASTNIYKQLKDIPADSIKVLSIKETPKRLGIPEKDAIMRVARMDAGGIIFDVTEFLTYNSECKERDDMEVSGLVIDFPEHNTFFLHIHKDNTMNYKIWDSKKGRYIESEEISRDEDYKYPEAGEIADKFLFAIGAPDANDINWGKLDNSDINVCSNLS